MEKDGKRIQQQVFASWDNFITLKCQKIHRFAETACITDLKAWITAYLNTHVFVEFSIDIEREREREKWNSGTFLRAGVCVYIWQDIWMRYSNVYYIVIVIPLCIFDKCQIRVPWRLSDAAFCALSSDRWRQQLTYEFLLWKNIQNNVHWIASQKENPMYMS